MAYHCRHDLHGQPADHQGVLGTPQTPFAQLRLMTFNVSPSLDNQTTSKSDETRSNIFVAGRPTLELESGSRIASIRLKNIKNGSKTSKGFIRTDALYPS